MESEVAPAWLTAMLTTEVNVLRARVAELESQIKAERTH